MAVGQHFFIMATSKYMDRSCRVLAATQKLWRILSIELDTAENGYCLEHCFRSS